MGLELLLLVLHPKGQHLGERRGKQLPKGQSDPKAQQWMREPKREEERVPLSLPLHWRPKDQPNSTPSESTKRDILMRLSLFKTKAQDSKSVRGKLADTNRTDTYICNWFNNNCSVAKW